MTREALKDDRVQVRPLELARRERLSARIRLMRAVPLLPGMKDAAERAHRVSLGGSHGRVPMRTRDRLTRGGWVGVECEARKRGKRRLRNRKKDGADEYCGLRSADCGLIGD